MTSPVPSKGPLTGDEWRCDKCGVAADERHECCEVFDETADHIEMLQASRDGWKDLAVSGFRLAQPASIPSPAGDEGSSPKTAIPNVTVGQVSPEQAIISDEEIARVHGNANFGPTMSPREVVNDGVRKYAVGYSGGHTQVCILREHGLITKPRPGSYEASLTKKGKRYARVLFHADKALIERQAAEIEALRKGREEDGVALKPFADMAAVRCPEEGGAPSWIDLMTNNGECDELELRSHVGLYSGSQVLDAADFRVALARLASRKGEVE